MVVQEQKSTIQVLLPPWHKTVADSVHGNDSIVLNAAVHFMVNERAQVLIGVGLFLK